MRSVLSSDAVEWNVARLAHVHIHFSHLHCIHENHDKESLGIKKKKVSENSIFFQLMKSYFFLDVDRLSISFAAFLAFFCQVHHHRPSMI
jgi:hypothetical protein